MKLFPKTFLYTLLLMILITLVGHALLYTFIPAVYTNQKESTAKQLTHEMAQQLKSLNADEIESVMQQYADKNQIFAKLDYAGEQFIFGTMFIEDLLKNTDSNYSFQAAPPDENAAIKPPGLSITEEGIENFLLYPSSTFIRASEDFVNINGKECKLETIVTLQPVNDTKDVIVKILPFTLVICFAISALFALLFSKRITKPIKHISKTTEQMKQLDQLAVCKILTKDEIGQLAQNVNSLYKNLLTTIAELQTEISHVSEVEESKIVFMRAASHELKTPVTAVRALIDNMIMGVGKFSDYETYLPVCKDMIEQLSAMIQEVLDASKLDLTNDEKKTTVSLSQYMDEIIKPFLMIAKSKGIKIKIELPSNITLTVPQKALKKAISNIISNAIAYTDTGNSVRISFVHNKMMIENECTPVPSEDLSHLFEAFYRVDYSRSRNTGGNGLGLYISGKILSIYGYEYFFKPTKDGMCFTISM